MTDGWIGGEMAEETNDLFAPAYDDFNNRYRNVQWTQRLVERAAAAGLEGNTLLDVACGTGHSLIPMLHLGWEVVGCDISRRMLERAREKVGAEIQLERADMRELPIFGCFDLVWAVNDPLNYLVSEDELAAALIGMGGNMKQTGVLVFDLNTLGTYQGFFAEQFEVKVRGRHLCWTGLNNAEHFEPEAIAEARFEALGEPGSVHIHRQRHFPEAQVLRAISNAGLTCAEVCGVTEPDGEFVPGLDEQLHSKAVYVCRK